MSCLNSIQHVRHTSMHLAQKPFRGRLTGAFFREFLARPASQDSGFLRSLQDHKSRIIILARKTLIKNERNFFHGYLYVLAIFCNMIQAIAIVPSVNLSWLDVTTIHLGERSLCLRCRHSERHESREISQSQIDIHNLTSHNRK